MLYVGWCPYCSDEHSRIVRCIGSKCTHWVFRASRVRLKPRLLSSLQMRFNVSIRMGSVPPSQCDAMMLSYTIGMSFMYSTVRYVTCLGLGIRSSRILGLFLAAFDLRPFGGWLAGVARGRRVTIGGLCVGRPWSGAC